VWTIPAGQAERDLDHPCKFPPELPRRLIKLYSYPDDVVLDPFLGSGTTLASAVKLGRQGVGVEINPSFCELAIANIQSAKLAQAS
jgi:site-specific DNA-methyltransferase (adenine-specific)